MKTLIVGTLAKTTRAPSDPYYKDQPEKAFVAVDPDCIVGCVTRGMAGYSPVYDYSHKGDELDVLGYEKRIQLTRETVARYNEALGLTPAQSAAAHIGSMFGWAVPGANPALYDSEGNPITARFAKG